MKKRLINIKCADKDSFEYSILFYLHYYNIKNNYDRHTEIDKYREPSLSVHFDNNNNINQFEWDNPFVDLLIIDINDKTFLTRNNANIKVTTVKINDTRYSLYKATLECFNDNINGINKLSTNAPKIYKLTDEIKKDFRLDLKYII